MGLRWSSSHPCLTSKYIFKMDDDIVVDYFHLMHYLLTNHYGQLQTNKTEPLLAGLIYNGTGPIRDESKWRVLTDEYAASYYPAYVSGWLWVTTPYTARLLISAADRSTPIFWVDDVWITGILREMKDIPLINTLNDFFTYQVELLECCVTDLNRFRYRCPLMVGPNVGNDKLVEQLLKATHKQCYNMTSDIGHDHCIERDLESLKKSCLKMKT